VTDETAAPTPRPEADLAPVLRSVMFAADSAAIDATAQGVTPHQVTTAAVHAAFECALGNGLIQITDPATWPEYYAIDPPYDPKAAW
jgi:hypothetical protein